MHFCVLEVGRSAESEGWGEMPLQEEGLLFLASISIILPSPKMRMLSGPTLSFAVWYI